MPAEVEPGDVVYMNGFTIHKTATEDCSGLRLATSIRYENVLEPTFIHRNYPCAYERKVNKEMITPDFPSKEDILNTLI